MREDRLQAMLNRSHWSGRASALQNFAATLRDKAGAAFTQNQDEKARILRDLATECDAQSKVERAKADEFAKEIED